MSRTDLSPDRFPLHLREIADPPRRLRVHGTAPPLDALAVAIVGSRQATRLGRDVAHKLGADLARAGIAVVSGLAYGIDASAHLGALDAGGYTVAVLGGGLDRIYPRANVPLARRIVAEGGALVSEYEDDAAPRRHHFPARNRLISGLCQAVVVVEASSRSGSLITARLAGEQGREVLAVPGPVTSAASKGCHRLLKEGAALVEDVSDVLFELGITSPAPGAPAAARPDAAVHGDAAVVLRCIDADTTPLDVIVARAGLDRAVVQQHLTELELDGFVDAQRGGYIRRLL